MSAEVQTEEPSQPVDGQIKYESEKGLLMVFSGRGWNVMGEWEMLRGAVKNIEEEREFKRR